MQNDAEEHESRYEHRACGYDAERADRQEQHGEAREVRRGSRPVAFERQHLEVLRSTAVGVYWGCDPSQ